MGMGFNTDVKHDGVVYHVQTEPRKDGSLETLVYKKGAIVHKSTSSYEEQRQSPDFNDDKLRGIVEDQHRKVIEGIRAGQIAPPPAQPDRSG